MCCLQVVRGCARLRKVARTRPSSQLAEADNTGVDDGRVSCPGGTSPSRSIRRRRDSLHDARVADAVAGVLIHLESGVGVEKDESKAEGLYQLTVDQFNAEAQVNLRVCYDFGKGVEKDESKAAELYQLAVDHGDAGAQFNLGVCYAYGEGVEKDES